MTVAICISPASVPAPVVITDTLTTDGNGIPFGEVATRTTKVREGASTQGTTLIRKSVIFENQAMVAFAGNLGTIVDFLDHAETAIKLSAEERPLKLLADRANDYDASRLRAIALLPKSDGSAIAHLGPKLQQLAMDHLGLYAAVGSGARWALEKIKQWQEVLTGEDIPDYQAAIQMAQVFCIDTLINEVYGTDEMKDRTWGGLLEYVRYDPNERKWLRQPRTAYFIYQFETNGDRKAHLIDRVFFYDPGNLTGWLQVVRRSTEGRFNATYRIPSLSDLSGRAVSKDWSDWCPEIISVAFVAGERHSNDLMIQGRNYTSFEVDDFNGVENRSDNGGTVFVPFGEKLESFLIEASAQALRQVRP